MSREEGQADAGFDQYILDPYYYYYHGALIKNLKVVWQNS